VIHHDYGLEEPEQRLEQLRSGQFIGKTVVQL
jgi:hypothetical protein